MTESLDEKLARQKAARDAETARLKVLWDVENALTPEQREARRQRALDAEATRRALTAPIRAMITEALDLLRVLGHHIYHSRAEPICTATEWRFAVQRPHSRLKCRYNVMVCVPIAVVESSDVQALAESIVSACKAPEPDWV